MIKLENINKFYGQTQVLKNINLTINEGEFVILLGKSGSGKSTLLNMIGLIDEPTSGVYTFNDINLYSLNNEEKSSFRSNNFGFIFQRYNLMPSQSVLENVIMSALYAKKNKAQSIIKAKKILNKLELSEHENKKTAHLSGGQQQRVSVARALINDANFILADEPTGALDSANGIKLMEILKELNKTGVGIILVTHDESLCKYASRVIKMQDACIISDEKNADFKPTIKAKKEVEKISFKDNFVANFSFFMQNVKLALSNIITHKMRSFLTMLGLIIATASVITTIALGNGGKAKVLEQINSLGSNTIIIEKGSRFGDRNAARLKDLTKGDLNLIKKLEYTKEVGVESVLFGSYVTYKNQDVNAITYGVYENYLQIESKKIAQGRFFTNQEEQKSKNICVLSDNLAKSLFKFESPINKVIYLNNKPLRVIGVLAKDDKDRAGFDTQIIIPFSTLNDKFDGRKHIKTIIVMLKDDVDNEKANENIKQILEIKKGKNSVLTYNLDAIKKSYESTVGIFSLIISGIAFIAMIVGGIGVMNIMLVVVKERTKEIGIKLAIGASPAYISKGFLIESVVLCLVAASIGVIIALGFIQIANIINFSLTLMADFNAIMLGFLSSVFVGLIFGYFPAKQASKLIPAVALMDD